MPVPQVQAVELHVELLQVLIVEKVVEILEVQVMDKIFPVPQTVIQEVVKQVPRVMVQDGAKQMPNIQVQEVVKLAAAPAFVLVSAPRVVQQAPTIVETITPTTIASPIAAPTVYGGEYGRGCEWRAYRRDFWHDLSVEPQNLHGSTCREHQLWHPAGVLLKDRDRCHDLQCSPVFPID